MIKLQPHHSFMFSSTFGVEATPQIIDKDAESISRIVDYLHP